MTLGRGGIERSLEISGILVGAGLIVEGISLLWSGPAAFLWFIFMGELLMGAGVFLYLYSLAAKTPRVENQ